MSIGGALSGQTTSGRSTRKTSIPGAGGKELRLQDIGLDISEQILAAITGQSGLQNFLLSQVSDLFSPQAIREVEERAGEFGKLRPEERDLIEQNIRERTAAGQSAIRGQLEEGLGFLRQELAPSRGLRPGDAPIVDRGGDIVKEALRQTGQLASGLQAEGANLMLRFPLERQQLQEQLRQQAFLNRMNLSSQTGQLGLGLGSVFDPTRLQSLFLQERLGQPTTRSSFSESSFGLTGKGQFGAANLFGG